MRLKSLLVASLIVSSSFSLELDDIVNKTLSDSYDLNKLNKDIQISNENLKQSTIWQNPIITIGANDIQFSDTFDRDKEPMQAQYIAVSQVVPVNNKLTYQENIALEDKKIAQMSLENKKLQLVSLIYEYGYNILIAQKKLELINKYQKNTKELEDVSLSLYESGKALQITPLNAKLLNSKLEIQKENLKYQINSLKYRLEQITYFKIDSIEQNIELKELNDIVYNIDDHPVVKSVEYKIKKFQEESKLQKSKKLSDIKVNVGYFSRDDKYTDYANFSLSIPLPVYGVENINIAKAKYKASQTQDELEIIKTKLENNVLILKEEMKKSFNNFKNLSNSMIPQREFIQQNIETHYALGHMKSIDLLSNINETISLELMALDELSKYYSAYAKSKYFTGLK